MTVVAERGVEQRERPEAACAVALNMMSAQRLHICRNDSSMAECYENVAGDEEQNAIVEKETRRWLFHDKSNLLSGL
jgi:hypothetical protein